MNVTIPLSLAELTGSLTGLVVWAYFVAAWAKDALRDWRWTNWVTLGIVIVTSLTGVFVLNAWHPNAEQIMWSVLLAVMATSFETWGYEAITNGLGKAFGIGTRSDASLLEQAELRVLEDVQKVHGR